MPFFIATSYRQTSMGIITSMDAGRDQQLVCASNSTLTATVIGNLAGHSVEWEQISGSTVSFTTPTNQLSVDFTQFAFDDKVFRFTIDKNLPWEMYDELSVFGTPTLVSTSAAGQLSKNSFINHPTPVSSITSLREDTPITVVYSNNISRPELLWTLPETPLKITGFEIQTSDGSGVWSVEAVASPNSRRYEPLYSNPTALYRVAAIFKTPNKTFSTTSNIIDRDKIQDELAYVNDHLTITLRQTQKTSKLLSYTRETLRLVNRPQDEELIVPGQNTQSSIIRAFTVDALVLISHAPDEETYYPAGQQASRSRMIAFSVEDLTGQNVGGG